MNTIKRPCKIVKNVFVSIVDADGNEFCICSPTDNRTDEQVAEELLELLNGSEPCGS